MGKLFTQVPKEQKKMIPQNYVYYKAKPSIIHHEMFDRKKTRFQRYLISHKSQRFQMLRDKGYTCSCCGREANVAYLMRHRNQGTSGRPNQLYLGLYIKQGNEHIKMTIDHVVPKSLGGINYQTNYVPMCEECNVKKGNTLSKDLSVKFILKNTYTKKEAFSVIWSVLKMRVALPDIKWLFTKYAKNTQQLKS